MENKSVPFFDFGSLSVTKGPLRQGGRGYNIDRLEKYIDLNPGAENIGLAEDLIYGITSRAVPSYASFYRGRSLYRLDFESTVNFRLDPGAATKINGGVSW